MEKCANLGFLFQKDYYSELTINDWLEKKAQARYFKKRNEDLIKLSKINVKHNPILNYEEEKRFTTFSLQTVYPGLITGIGMIHQTGMQGECKLGMAFDYTSGLPFIPGSSVKGLLRSVFPILHENKSINRISEEEKKLIEAKRAYILETWDELKKKESENFNTPEEVDELAQLIFNGKKSDDKYLPIYERDIFFDAEIEGDYSEKGILDLDYITPHKDEFGDPNPIKFLKILPKVTFVFSFRLSDSTLTSGIKISSDAKVALFKKILTTIGIGAKTNVGYGQLSEKENASISPVTQTETLTIPTFQNNHVNPTNSSEELEDSMQTKANNQVQTPIIKELITTGKLVKIPGLSGYKVRIEDAKYSKDLYDLIFRSDPDKKSIGKKTEKVNIEVTLRNNKVLRVTFKSSI